MSSIPRRCGLRSIFDRKPAARSKGATMFFSLFTAQTLVASAYTFLNNTRTVSYLVSMYSGVVLEMRVCVVLCDSHVVFCVCFYVGSRNDRTRLLSVGEWNEWFGFASRRARATLNVVVFVIIVEWMVNTTTRIQYTYNYKYKLSLSDSVFKLSRLTCTF